MADPTPGQIAYEAYRRTLLPSDWRVALGAWEDLPALHTDAWDAAAQAAIVHHEEQIQLRASLLVSTPP